MNVEANALHAALSRPPEGECSLEMTLVLKEMSSRSLLQNQSISIRGQSISVWSAYRADDMLDRIAGVKNETARIMLEMFVEGDIVFQTSSPEGEPGVFWRLSEREGRKQAQ